MDVTIAHVGVSRDDFLTHLVTAELISEGELAALRADTSLDIMQLSERLLSNGRLSPFQLDSLMAGRPQDLRVGNYDILSKLGQGGMGTVYKARHRRMKRLVALKVLSAKLCEDASFVARFQREVETIARLGHPNIVMAYDADEAEMGHFLVMEFIDGRDLASEVEKQGPMDDARAIDYTLQSARGLAYAHSQGIVHRDVKPHNLLKDERNIIKVTDLGLASLSTGKTENNSLTQSGGILGTVDYMPPEQAVDSATIDARADIYSLGCTLYFLLSGGPPYTGQSLMSVLLKHRDAPIPLLTALRDSIPPRLNDIYLKMLAKSTADRYQTMSEVVQALEQCAVELGHQPGPTTTPRPNEPGTIKASSTINLNRVDQNTITHRHVEVVVTKVLIVEPSRVQAGIIRKYLEPQGITVTANVATGADAIVAIQKERPSAILSSMHLADMTGIELASKIRADFPRPAPGFVLITSESEGINTGKLSQLNRVVLLAKPFTAEQLAASLQLVTGQSVSSMTMSESTIPKKDRSRLRVLVVDDSGTARMNERMILSSLGFTQISEATDGAQAIAAATRENFDLIVTDYNMPLLDGHALVSYLKQTPSTASVPIVMVTTETDSKILDPVRQLGVAAIFPKAFPKEEVGALVDRLFP